MNTRPPLQRKYASGRRRCSLNLPPNISPNSPVVSAETATISKKRLHQEKARLIAPMESSFSVKLSKCVCKLRVYRRPTLIQATPTFNSKSDTSSLALHFYCSWGASTCRVPIPTNSIVKPRSIWGFRTKTVGFLPTEKENESQLVASRSDFNMLLSLPALESVIGYLPVIPSSPTEAATAYEHLNRSTAISARLGQSHTIITVDQAIYCKAQEMKWKKESGSSLLL